VHPQHLREHPFLKETHSCQSHSVASIFSSASRKAEITTAIAHLRDVLGNPAYESLARTGETMTTAAMATYAYDQIDQARAELNAVSKQNKCFANVDVTFRPRPRLLRRSKISAYAQSYLMKSRRIMSRLDVGA
jgi:hypothetical protein